MEGNTTNQNITPNPVGFPGAPVATNTAPKKNWKWLVILILFLVVIGGVTFFVFKSSKSASLEESPTPDTGSLTNIATPQPSPTALPSPTDKSTINIQVLNGTGIAGEAGILSDQLKALGYTGITTGNASAQNSTDTQVTFSSTVATDVVTEITNKLKDMYVNVTTSSSDLPSGIQVQVVTGLRKGSTAAPTSTDTPAATDVPTATP